MQFGKIPACKLGGEGVEVRNEGRAAVWREHLSQVRAVADCNKQYNQMFVCLLLAADSSSICPNVVVCSLFVCHQVEKSLLNAC